MLKRLSSYLMLDTQLGRSTVMILLLISLAVLATNSWTLWNSWQNSVRQTEIQAINSTVSLSRQAEDTFLQAEITLHVAGDRCLKLMGEALRRLPLGKNDLVARYGGEEFAIVLPHADSDSARRLAMHILSEVRQPGLEHSVSRLAEKVVTLSVGVYTAVADGSPGEAERFVLRADSALYQAKKQGRNRVALYQAAG